MKRVLILAYDFPPMMSAGAARPYGWYLYMKKYGLEPIVVTRNWSEDLSTEFDVLQAAGQSGTKIDVTEYGTLIQVDYLPNLRDRWVKKKATFLNVAIRKFLSFVYQYLPFLTFKDDSTRMLFVEADAFLKENTVDLILATGSPFHLFRYASKLSKKHSIPWFADFRDLWSYYPDHGLGFMTQVVEKGIDRMFERRSVKSAKAIISVTQPCIDILEKAHRKPVYLGLNGYIDYNQNNSKKSNSIPNHPRELKMVYIGTLYDYYPLEQFFEGFNSCVKSSTVSVSLTFIGMNFYPEQKKRIQKMAEKEGQKIYFTDKMSPDALQKALDDYDVLLLFGKENGLSIHIKIFEYLLLSKPILFFAKNNQVIGDIIRDTSSGYICETSDQLQKLLEQLSIEKQQKGFLQQEVKNIETYSREFQTEKLVQFLKKELATTISN